MSKPTLVFVHGGWHDPSCLDLIRKPLENLGYQCRVPDLPSIGDQAAIKSVDDDVRIVHDIISKCLSNGEDVVVIAHSSGGLTANGALEGLVGDDLSVKPSKGKVLGLGLIAAMIPPIVEKGAFKDVPPLDASWWVFSVSAAFNLFCCKKYEQVLTRGLCRRQSQRSFPMIRPNCFTATCPLTMPHIGHLGSGQWQPPECR